MIRCSECGRPALSRPIKGRFRSRKAIAGQPVAHKGHDLCQQCFRRELDRLRVAKMKDR